MRVHIDESGRDDAVTGVDLVACLTHLAELDDAAALDADVGSPAIRTRSVDDGPAPNGCVEHRSSPRTVGGTHARLGT